MCGILFGCNFCCSDSPCSSVKSRVDIDKDAPDEVMNLCNSDSMQHDEDAVAQGDIYEVWKTDQFIERRGPDASRLHKLELSNTLKGLMRGCVLHLRGNPTPQPLIDSGGNTLLWNGEIFDGIKVEKSENDTHILSNLLSACSSEEDILKTLEQIHGPWSFIYWQTKRKTLWFGRDMYGRRSLLWHLPSLLFPSLVITSVAVGDLEYTEIPAVGIFTIDFSNMPSGSHGWNSTKDFNNQIEITLHPWLSCRWPESTQIVAETDPKDVPSLMKYSSNHISISIAQRQILQSWIPSMNASVPLEDAQAPHECPLEDVQTHHESSQEDIAEDNLVKMLETVLRENSDLRLLSEKLVSSLHLAVERRLNNVTMNQSPAIQDGTNYSKAKIAVLFSGGLDSSVLAALADRCVPLDEPIDLLNVAFEQPYPEPVKSKQKHKLKKQHRCMNDSEDLEKSQSGINEQVLPALTSQELSQSEVNEISMRLSKSSSPSEERRDQSYLDNTLHNISDFNEFQVGGQVKDTIPSTHTSVSSSVSIFDPYDVPDRQTGKIAYSELCHVNPRRKWNFIEINVSQEELKSERKSRIRKLIYPLCTVLDDSIGCALWFAARGKGKLSKEPTIVSKARVILCGMAADEQFAGYSRHRVHFKKFGWEGLISQLQKEMWRISQRNLGRDDRIISDHGKEARFPFLDESFTKFVSEIPVHLRADLQLPRGIGEKLLLRISAFTLGLRKTSCHAKRAIQFGSKIAKLDKTKEKGSDVCERLL